MKNSNESSDEIDFYIQKLNRLNESKQVQLGQSDSQQQQLLLSKDKPLRDSSCYSKDQLDQQQYSHPTKGDNKVQNKQKLLTVSSASASIVDDAKSLQNRFKGREANLHDDTELFKQRFNSVLDAQMFNLQQVISQQQAEIKIKDGLIMELQQTLEQSEQSFADQIASLQQLNDQLLLAIDVGPVDATLQIKKQLQQFQTLQNELINRNLLVEDLNKQKQRLSQKIEEMQKASSEQNKEIFKIPKLKNLIRQLQIGIVEHVTDDLDLEIATTQKKLLANFDFGHNDSANRIEMLERLLSTRERELKEVKEQSERENALLQRQLAESNRKYSNLVMKLKVQQQQQKLGQQYFEDLIVLE